MPTKQETTGELLDRIEACLRHDTTESPCEVCHGTMIVGGSDWCTDCCCGVAVEETVSEEQALADIKDLRARLDPAGESK